MTTKERPMTDATDRTDHDCDTAIWLGLHNAVADYRFGRERVEAYYAVRDRVRERVSAEHAVEPMTRAACRDRAYQVARALLARR